MLMCWTAYKRPKRRGSNTYAAGIEVYVPHARDMLGLSKEEVSGVLRVVIHTISGLRSSDASAPKGLRSMAHRSRSSSGSREDLDGDPGFWGPKPLDSNPSQPLLPDPREDLRGVGETMPCSTSANWSGDLWPEPEAIGSMPSSSLSSW